MAFDEADDPYGEHDFGAVTGGGGTLFWKIDYYDHSSGRLHLPPPMRL